MNNKTAILIFANTAKFEAAQKPFQSSEVLFDAFNAQTLKIVERAGLPYFHSSEKNQIGSTFGERFTNAIQSVYEKGFDTIIAIGNDTPHLQTKHILKAVQQLEQNDVVLGPSKDGGFYLMGLKQSNFNVETFLKLPWQTSRLNQSISRLIRSKKVNLYYLETLSDIDKTSDIKAIMNRFERISNDLKQLLKTYISIEKRIYYTSINLVSILSRDTYFNKGSPSLV
ncbi:TIGR04282 family arsenosugar biosynthesis glycosyltransferase [Psychroserpens luteolus]|uniref:TIGR04282 family arsenosugar biosynthesis glycosyltransferase n=1 Tax=Psychroserpens luteolus TaxID=2855840 RepID=UPI001E4971DA|nr:DUF2064 domain-containing protein [Psychroserpens luteolus]MCD2257758.1 DUF2064 domain-containing protein [Psychroserpens luteolus]